MSARFIEVGCRYVLPSGRIVIAISRSVHGGNWECGYVNVDGALMRPGTGMSNRIAMRNEWLLRHATALAK